MSNRLSNFWETLRTSFWLLPALMGLLAVGLREAVWLLDAATADHWAAGTWFLGGGSGDDARNLLTALVTALLALAGVMFSITMVVLTLAANQYGSRLVRTYTRDLRTQLALGTFVLTVVYCLLVLRSVAKDMQPADVPHVAVALALLLAFACILALLLFLGVVTRLIVADVVVGRVAGELEDSVEALPPLGEGSTAASAAEALLPGDLMERSAVVRSRDEGYVQSIEYDTLAERAARADVLVRFDYRAGAFMCREGWLALVYPRERLTPELEDGIRSAVLIGGSRTPTQDLEFSIRHLVDMALRALSPGINDPNTALAVVDRMRGALARAMARQLPCAVRRDGQGTLRVVGDQTGFDGLFDAAFHQIRQAGQGQPAVIIYLLGAVARLAEHARTPEQAKALSRHADLMAAAGLRGADDPGDKADIEGAHAAARRKLRHLAPMHPVDSAARTAVGR